MDQLSQTPSPGSNPPQEQRAPMKIWEKILWVLVALVFLFILYVSVDANKYKTQVKVADQAGTVGVNPTTSSLDFGDLSRGSSAGRRIKIANNTPLPMFISIVELGDIRDLLTILKNNFRLPAGQTVEVDFLVSLPASAELNKTYTGRVTIFRIPTL